MKPHCRVKPGSVALLLTLSMTTMVLFRGWYSEVTLCSSAPSEKKVHVLLLSSWRSGSSFLGQAFSQHPDVFYLMEPGWHLWTTMQKSGMRSMRMGLRDLMRSLYLCDFTVMDSYLPDVRGVSQLFMWSHSRALCSPPACSLTPRGEFSNQTLCVKKCDARGLQGAQESCTTHSHVVLKEVRFFELESLYPLFQDPSLDLRIIHLIRDPRAVERSRAESYANFIKDNAAVLEQRDIPKGEIEYQVMKEICRSHVRIYETAMKNPPPFLEGRYKMIRYEDLARNPLEEVAALYDFIDLEMTDKLEEWIYRVTHGKAKRTIKDAFTITSRNAMSMSEAWRTKLPHSAVKRVQQVCNSAMSFLGYRMVDNEQEQKRLDLDLLVPRAPLHFDWLPSKDNTEVPQNS